MEKKTNAEIIRQDLTTHYQGLDVETKMRQMSAAVKRGLVNLRRIGDTVIMYRPDLPGTVEFHIFNLEKPAQTIQNIEKFADELKHIGVERLVTTLDNPRLASLVKAYKGKYTLETHENPDGVLVLEVPLQ